MADPLPHGLHQQAHRLASHRDMAFHAQDMLFAGEAGDTRDEILGIGDLGHLDHDRFEIVMLVIVCAIVMRGAGIQIVLGGGIEAKDHARSITPSVIAKIGSLRGASASITAFAAASPASPARSAFDSSTISAQAI